MGQSAVLSTMTPVQAYEQYLVPALFIPAVQLLLQHAALKPGERVLDVACGTGIVARHAAPLVGVQGTLTAIDINPLMLATARMLPPPAGAKIDWREGSVMVLPFADKSYDAVLCQQGLQFFPDKSAALREMRRVLVSGGRLVLSVQQSLDANPIYAEFNQAFLRHMGIAAVAQPFVMGDAEKLEALLVLAGLQDVEVTSVEHPVRFASPALFVLATVLGSAAAVPALMGLDTAARADLIDKISHDMKDTLARYTRDGAFGFRLASLLASGYA